MPSRPSDYKDCLKKALARRAVLFEPSSLELTDAFRLCDGMTEGIPGLVIDKYASVAIFQLFEQAHELSLDQIRELGDWLLSHTSIESIYLKDFIKDRSQSSPHQDHYASEPFAGKQASPKIVCKENGAYFEIHPYDGFSCGLFLDQRSNRLFFRDTQKENSQLLNLFSYTCAFSVMGALGGAHTTSVDLSRKAIDWGKRNFELNGLDPHEHSFYSEDVFEFLKRRHQKNDSFDLILIDPPSFSRGKGNKVWSLRKDYRKLLEAVLPLVRENGMIFFSCNLLDWSSENLWKQSESILKLTGKWKRRTLPVSPLDFRGGSRSLSQWAAFKL